MKLIKIGLFIFVVLVLGYYLTMRTTLEYVDVKVTKTERVTSEGESYYLIFTSDEVFKNSDNLLFLKFNSSDIYNELSNGGEYRVKVVGWRYPFFSMYRNILTIEEIKN